MLSLLKAWSQSLVGKLKSHKPHGIAKEEDSVPSDKETPEGSQLTIHTFQAVAQGVVVVQSLSHVQLFATPWTAAHQASLSFTISQSLLKLMSIEFVVPTQDKDFR